MSADRLAIFCCGGALPREVALAARADGEAPLLIGVVGLTDAEIGDFDHVWLRMGEIGGLFGAFAAHGVGRLVLIGAMTRPDWRELRLDWGALKRAVDLAKLFRGGDDSLLRGVVEFIEGEGVRVVGVADVAPELIAGAGAMTRTKASADDEADARFGLSLLHALSPFDIGQGAVVSEGRVIAVEAAEGTDAMLRRVAELRAGGQFRAAAPGGIFVKAPKAKQDLRFDLPTIGPATVVRAKAAGLRGLALAAGGILIVDRARTLRDADAAGLFVAGMGA